MYIPLSIFSMPYRNILWETEFGGVREMRRDCASARYGMYCFLKSTSLGKLMTVVHKAHNEVPVPERCLIMGKGCLIMG